ncbi:MAG: hypothetical protein FWD25_03170 [Clostridia bacterium]|nr:hypothetical protein [Clostridia bacterium]
MESISQKDRTILRRVAAQQMELASMPYMQTLTQRWIRHNACEPGLPMIVVEWGTFSQEAITPRLQCEGEIARRVEWRLYANFIGHLAFGDDSFVPDYMPVRYGAWFKPFDIDVVVEHIPGSDNSLGHHFREAITDLSRDFHLLKPSTFGVNRQETASSLALCNDLFGDILPAKLSGAALYSVPTQHLVHIMSMETMLFSLYDYPDEFHRMMQMLANDTLRYFRFLETEGLLLPTTRNEPVGNGTFAFTDVLPSQGPLTARDVWGFMDSQESAGISPQMYGEFIFPYYEQIAQEYGLMSYGCCEAVHSIWDHCLSKLSNLRKLSISPWCDERYMGERLAGSKIVYHRKPSPNYLGVDAQLDAPALKAHIDQTLIAAKGCTIEFTQRDAYTVHGNMEKVREFVRIVRRCCQEQAG